MCQIRVTKIGGGGSERKREITCNNFLVCMSKVGYNILSIQKRGGGGGRLRSYKGEGGNIHLFLYSISFSFCTHKDSVKTPRTRRQGSDIICYRYSSQDIDAVRGIRGSKSSLLGMCETMYNAADRQWDASGRLSGDCGERGTVRLTRRSSACR